jgi:hypothetical protein
MASAGRYGGIYAHKDTAITQIRTLPMTDTPARPFAWTARTGM